jgi:hypothetical protein
MTRLLDLARVVALDVIAIQSIDTVRDELLAALAALAEPVVA